MSLEDCVLQGLSYRSEHKNLEVKESSGKGRGVFCTANIKKGDYLCEYRTCRVYSKAKKAKYEKEYEANNEGCYLLETLYGKKLVFDATRCFDQYGRYINHARGKTANCKYHPPLRVRGKWRVGFYAIRDINPGEELLYDYGIRSEPWMEGSSVARAKPTKGKTPSMEKYRKRRYCPVEGCSSDKPLKKLSNHLVAMHPSLTAAERKMYLKSAKRAHSRTMSSPLQTKAANQHSITQWLPKQTAIQCVTANAQRKGTTKAGKKSTKSYGRFTLDDPFFKQFMHYLVSPHGLNKTKVAAKATAVEISKYLYFATNREGHSKLEPSYLHNASSIEAYVEKVEADGIEVAGQLTKLQRITTAIDFGLYELHWRHDPEKKGECEDTLHKISRWCANLNRSKQKTQRCSIQQRSEEALQYTDTYHNFTKMSQPKLDVENILGKSEPLQVDDYYTLLGWLAATILYGSVQRPGVVESMTIEEFHNSTIEIVDSKQYHIIQVSMHKTSAAYGPAKVVVPLDLHEKMQKFLDFRRGRGKLNNFFVHYDGTKVDKITRLVQTYAKKKYNVMLPNPTFHRSVVATRASALTEGEQEKVSGLMCHSLTTQRKYYRLNKSRKDAVEAFNIVQTQIDPGPSPFAGVPGPQKRQRMDAKDTTLIENAFKQHIESLQAPSLKECEKFLEAHPIMGRKSKHVQDKVRSFIKAKKRQLQ